MPYGGTRPYRLYTRGYRIRCFKTSTAMFEAFYALSKKDRRITELYEEHGLERQLFTQTEIIDAAH